MRRKLMYCGIAAFLVLLFGAVSSVAHEVTISSTATLGTGPTLDAGRYRVEVIQSQDSSHAVFYREQDEVARAPVTLVAEDSKARQTEVHSQVVDGRHVITVIRLRGASEKLVFSQSADETGQSK